MARKQERREINKRREREKEKREERKEKREKEKRREIYHISTTTKNENSITKKRKSFAAKKSFQSSIRKISE